MKLKDVIIKYRSEKLLTQEQIALEIGVSIGTIIKIEKGEKASMLVKAKIANYLNIDINEIED